MQSPSPLFDDWLQWSFSQYSNGKDTLNRHQMKLAVISMTGKKPTVLPKSQTTFTQDDLRHYVQILNHGNIIGNVSDLYDCFDKNGQGFVTLEDIIAVADASNAPTPKDALADAFQRVDRDSDGRVSYRDFLATINTGLAELGVL